ncbi:MAG TPA: MOSC N-terminal beta barrel domain-containing protein [Caldimonas sp.]|jgi:hypothetical protein|nr:MOSC N-terminal beta barrel domain-containing protein [Caldimonas sp.]HEX2540825.1 MOSC N-terminal beta barrel domain-containing protein [Caldimonas sp.]
MSDDEVRVQSLHVYPVKSCAGTSPREAEVVETGFDLDRAWMVVDESGLFVSQRELPRMALVQPSFKGSDVVLRAPGMLALHISPERVESATEVQVWDDRLAAFDMGDLCAQWFSDFLGRKLRLARFDPDVRRLSERRWTGALAAENTFQDAFPFLVASSAALAEVNRRLALAGKAAVTMARFRPNIVLDGLDAHGEDHVDEIVFDTADGALRLKLVKPCSRCSIPDVDPATGEPGHAVGDVLAQYRADPRLDGAITFGMNAVVVEGMGQRLHVGATGRASYAF